MKKPWYEISPGAVQALLSTRQFVECYIYSIILANGGGTLRYCDGPIDVAISGNVWTSKGLLVSADNSLTNVHWKTGTNVDTWFLSVAPRAVDALTGIANPDKLNNAQYQTALRSGILDGAEVQIDLVVAPTWPGSGALTLRPTGAVTLFYGLVAGVDFSRSQAVIGINSHLGLLTTSMPRRTFQSGCPHVLFDADCTLAKASFSRTGVVSGSGLTQSNIPSTVAAPPGSGTYTLGTLTMTSGQANGNSRFIRLWDGFNFTPIYPFFYTIVPGDTFIAYAGCDKTQATCTKFGNLVNFAGQPYIPDPETAI